MRPPLFVRPLTEAERQQVQAGLRSAEAFTLRRSQIVLASARREPVLQIARELGCGEQTVRNAIHAFNTQGAAAGLLAPAHDPGRLRTRPGGALTRCAAPDLPTRP